MCHLPREVAVYGQWHRVYERGRISGKAVIFDNLWEADAFPTITRSCEATFPLNGEISQVSCKKGQKPIDLSSPIVYNNYRSGQLNIVCHFRGRTGMVADLMIV